MPKLAKMLMTAGRGLWEGSTGEIQTIEGLDCWKLPRVTTLQLPFTHTNHQGRQHGIHQMGKPTTKLQARWTTAKIVLSLDSYSIPFP